MATGNVIISVRGGSTDRQNVELVPGTPADAFSVGSDGSWRVSGPGVSSVHAYLYFDGTTLFVASAPGERVALGGASVGTDWCQVAAPAEITFGGVALDVQLAAREPSKEPLAMPRAPSRPSRPPSDAKPGHAAHDQRQEPKPVRRPDPTSPPVPAAEPGAGTYDDSEGPTQFQPMPEGFLAGPGSVPDGATPSQEEPAISEERTHVMNPPSEGQTAAVPQRPVGTPYGAPPQQFQVQPQAPSPEAAPRHRPKPPRPEPPSNRPITDAATVVKPLEQFLAEASRPAIPLAEAPDTAKRPLAAPIPAAGQPPPGRGPSSVIITSAEATGPPGASYQQAPVPGAYGAPPGYAPNAQYPGMPYGAGVEMPARPGLPTPMGYAQQQYPGAPQAGAYPPQQGMVGFPPGQPPPWGAQAQAPAKSKDPLAAWKAMPFPRKLMIIMLPFGLVAFVIIFAPDRPRAPSRKPASSASMQGPATSAPRPPPSATGAPSVPISAPPTSAAPPTSVVAPTASPNPPTSAAPVASAQPEKLPRGQVTTERQAADAVASGDLPKAIELYDRLAKEHPENPAFARAADILRRRVKK